MKGTEEKSLSWVVIKGGEMGIELESIGSKDFFPHELEYQRKKVG